MCIRDSLQTWDFLPKWMTSLAPMDRAICGPLDRMICGPCQKALGKDKEVQLSNMSGSA